MDRLTADDLVVLWPDASWPQDIGALAMLDGRGPDVRDGQLSVDDVRDGQLSVDDVRAAVGRRIDLVPRMRQILWSPPRWLGAPLWVDASDFDLADHIRVRVVPESAAEPAESRLLDVVEQLLARRMDRSRPLWEMWLLPGLPDGRVGLFVRIHHVMADGMAGMSILTDLLDDAGPLDDARPAAAGSTAGWFPRPAPSSRELLLDNVHRSAVRLGHGLRRLARPDRIVRGMVGSWPQLRGRSTAPPTPRTSLDRLVGAGRRLAVLRSDLRDVSAIAHAADATVNDVLLAVIAGGLDALLRHRAEPVTADALPVYVPVSLRPRDERAHARGNRIGQMVVPVPLGVRDPADRLARIARSTRSAKAQGHPALGAMLGSRLARRLLLRFLADHPVSVTTADIPGPDHTLRLAGAPVLAVFPILPLISRVTLGIAALSYAGTLAITVIADRDSHPDLPVFAAAVGEELAALRALAAPGRSGT